MFSKKKMMILISSVQLICLSSLLLASLAEANQKEAEVSLQTICENKQKVNLKAISQVRKLITDVRKERPDLCEPYLNSFIELEPILKVVESGQTCNLDMVNMLRDYHYEFINGSEKKNEDDKITNPLRFFFISLCFQISAECKMTLINSLEYDTKENITEEDYKTTDMLEKYGATLLDRNTKVTDFDDILLLSDINSAIGMDESAKDTKIMIKVKTNLMLKNLVKTCRLKFRPYYEKLILPLIVLSNLGYNYQGELLAREIKELKDSELIRRWYNIVQTCEAFSAIEIYEDTENSVLENQQAITLINKEEANSLRSKQVNKPPQDGENAIVYVPQPSHNSDELWIQDQSELENLVNKYKASASESERIKKKLLKKLFDKFKESLKAGKVGVFMSGIYGGLAKDKNDKKTNINEDMVSMMDDVISKTEETSVINLQDTAVSGAGRHGRLPPRRPGRGPGGGMSAGMPAKVVAIPDVDDQSKLGNKVFERTIGKFLPQKWDLLMWFMGTIGILLIIAACVMG